MQLDSTIKCANQSITQKFRIYLEKFPDDSGGNYTTISGIYGCTGDIEGYHTDQIIFPKPENVFHTIGWWSSTTTYLKDNGTRANFPDSGARCNLAYGRCSSSNSTNGWDYEDRHGFVRAVRSSESLGRDALLSQINFHA